MNEWAVAGRGNRIVFFFTSQETRTRLENREANRPGEREGRAKKQTHQKPINDYVHSKTDDFGENASLDIYQASIYDEISIRISNILTSLKPGVQNMWQGE